MALNVILIGIQGSGKGTQSPFITQTFGIPQISTGDLFRALPQTNPALAAKVKEIMDRGDLVPDSITNEMVEERLQLPDAQDGAIFDGYPRNDGQADFLEGVLAKRGQRVNAVLVLNLAREIAFQRAVGRRFSQDKQRVYNIYTNPPKVEGMDDVDSQPLFQRSDDQPDAVNKRLDDYFALTMPLISYYKAKGLVYELDASQSIAAVRAEIERILNKVKQ